MSRSGQCKYFTLGLFTRMICASAAIVEPDGRRTRTRHARNWMSLR